jgi:excisionase family DNA binding protein
MPRLPSVLTPQDVADRLHVSKATVLTYIRNGDLPACTTVKPFLIRAEDYQAFRAGVWPTLGRGKHGRPVRGKGQAHVDASLLELVYKLNKLTGR